MYIVKMPLCHYILVAIQNENLDSFGDRGQGTKGANRYLSTRSADRLGTVCAGAANAKQRFCEKNSQTQIHRRNNGRRFEFLEWLDT